MCSASESGEHRYGWMPLVQPCAQGAADFSACGGARLRNSRKNYPAVGGGWARVLGLVLVIVVAVAAGTAGAQTTQTSNSATIALDPSSDLIDSNPSNNEDTAVINVEPPPDISFHKSADLDVASVGDTITYTVTVTVADAPLTQDFVATDTLGPGLAFGAVTSSGSFSCNGANPLRCTLPAGTAPGSYSFSYTAIVTDSADTQVENAVTGEGGGDPTPSCDGDCDIVIPINPAVTYHKVADVTSAPVGDIVTYTVTVEISNAPLPQDLLLQDNFGTGLAFVDFIDPVAPFVCSGGASPQCTLPAGTGPGSFTVSYTAQITPDAGATVTNNVSASGGGEPPVCDAECSVVVDVVFPSIVYNKVADTAGPVSSGENITYTITVEIADAPLNADLILSDTLGPGLDFVAVTNANPAFSCGSGISFDCTLPAGTVPGVYSFDLTATVNATATGSVINSVTADGGGGNQPPVCNPDCDPHVPITDTYITYSKTGAPALAQIGDTVTYQVSTTVSNSSTTAEILVADTLGAGLVFNQLVSADSAYTCPGNTLPCTIPANTAPGTYVLTYTATITADAGDSVSNALVETGGGGAGPDCVGSCTVTTDILRPVVTYEKTASPAGPVQVGDLITYTIAVDVADARLTADLQLTDTLGTGLDFVGFDGATAPFTCSSGNSFDCTLPAGAGPGSFALTFTARVNDQALAQVQNTVTAAGADNPTCSGDCAPVTPLADAGITVSKAASPSPVAVGDTITFTVTTTIASAPLTSDLQLTDTLGTGLTFAGLDSANTDPAYQCALGDPLYCALPVGTAPGTYVVTYMATVNASAGESVENSVEATGGSETPPDCVDCATVTPVIRPAVTYRKVPDVTQVEIGDVVTYTVSVTVADTALDGDVVLQDALGSGLQFQAFDQPTDPFSCTGSGPLICTLPAGTAPGTYTFSYTALVTPEAGTSVSNRVTASNEGGGNPPECDGDCAPVIPVVGPQITYSKTADKDRTAVGDTITYTVEVEITDAALSSDLNLEDSLDIGLIFGTLIQPVDPFSCSPGKPLQCVLPNGTQPGTYAFSYTATVTEDAGQSVRNQVTASGGGGDPVCSAECAIIIPLAPQVTYHKTAVPAEAQVGDTITYTVDVMVRDADLSEDLTLTDTTATGLAIEQVTDAGNFRCSGQNPLTCVLPAGTAPGDYQLTYTALVTEDSGDSVSNSVVASGGGTQPECDGECAVTTPVKRPAVTYEKSASVSQVRPGDVVTYGLSVTVTAAALSEPVVLTDTPGVGLSFIAVTDSGGFSCNDASPLVCSLPAGTAPGTYSLQYTARVTAEASGTVDNAVVASGGGGSTPACAEQCDIHIPLVDPQITVSKSANPVSGTEVVVGQTIVYTLLVGIENSALPEDLLLTDIADTGLTITSIPPDCVQNGNEFQCTLPAGSPVGEYELMYTAVVNNGAGAEVTNLVVPAGGGDANPECAVCETRHPVEPVSIRLQKTASVREAQVGDIVFYTLTAENISSRDLINGIVVDTPPAGFTYVEGSLVVDDVDQSGILLNTYPLTVGDIDIPAGDTAIISYALRVGAGVRPGSYVNEAEVQDADGDSVSNRATAEVVLAVDPLTQESLIIGTVFHDRNGNSIQDSANLTGVRVRGGFDPAFYVPGTTSINGVAVADASAPLLRGLELGELPGVSGEGSGQARIVIRQKLTRAAFTDDFKLSSHQGYTLRLDAAGVARVRQGNSAAAVQIKRRLEITGDGVFVDYIIVNRGLDERGIPGVRIASVDGLLVETDRYGRYHLVGIDGGHWERGRNFILKVDTATLPEGTRFTTSNPLIRRVTPGVPVRFDFGVLLPPLYPDQPASAARPLHGGAE
ncbi:isopeptide-forming domain-containing fimbrial protein [Microbulbifer harenosus]|uniref:Isopeptide-forming domain-containing fimbrial protein n=1 Tax=Microbulbifer harenosus TaxID=2576840 RepID=A0ABY2UDE5_9GAMM|nr:isopeptide-forming domain-containing fimbrial protein [Microbulbifer harenosus]